MQKLGMRHFGDAQRDGIHIRAYQIDCDCFENTVKDPDPTTRNVVTFDGTRWSNAQADVVYLVEPDPAWPARYAAEVQGIRKLLSDAADGFRFEHVGSTAISGLAAKPIIDLLLIPQDGSWPKEILERQLPLLGYVFWAENPDPKHLFFVKGMPPFGKGRTHHLHVRPTERAAPVLAFRDYLRAHPQTAQAYAELKRRLSAEHPNERDAYTRGKDDFVAAVLKKTTV
jgi:GrpB-like predicted nucleotidyltransferase (UPF0157 family)